MAKPQLVTIQVPEGPVLDPNNINGRLYQQLDMLLQQLEQGEHVTLKERTAAMLVVVRIQYIFMQLRKEKVGDVNSGTAVRKYATAFTKDAARGRKKIARAPEPEPEPDDLLGFDDDGDDAA